MTIIKSHRANKLIEEPRFFKRSKTQSMRAYPGPEFSLFVELEWDQDNVKNLSFQGEVESWQRVLLESWALITVGKNFSRLDQVSLRECEAFLRDRNSEPAVEEIPPEAEEDFKQLFTWIKQFPRPNQVRDYTFSSDKGPFRNLKLTEKVRELKGFLNSPDVLSLYQGLSSPQLLDVEDLTVYLDVPYQTERERALFEELHMLGVEAFQEECLNFIPDA